MTTAKQRAWREKFARLYGRGRKQKKKHKRGDIMSRKGRFRVRRRGGLLSGKLAKGLMFAVAGGVMGRMLGVNPLLTSAGAGFFGAGITGAAIGAGAEMLGVGNIVSNTVSGITGKIKTTGMRIYG